MGLSASQSRLLTLTSRLSDLELKAQKIQHQKVRLSEQSTEAAKKYMNALDSQKLLFNSAELGKVEGSIKNITSSELYRIADTNGNYFYCSEKSTNTAQTITTSLGNTLNISSNGSMTYTSANNTTKIQDGVITTITACGTLMADGNASATDKKAVYVSPNRNISVMGSTIVEYSDSKEDITVTDANKTTVVTSGEVSKKILSGTVAYTYSVTSDNAIKLPCCTISKDNGVYTIDTTSGSFATINISEKSGRTNGASSDTSLASSSSQLGLNYLTTDSDGENINNKLLLSVSSNGELVINDGGIVYSIGEDKLSISHDGKTIVSGDTIPEFNTSANVIFNEGSVYTINADGTVREKIVSENLVSGIHIGLDTSTSSTKRLDACELYNYNNVYKTGSKVESDGNALRVTSCANGSSVVALSNGFQINEINKTTGRTMTTNIYQVGDKVYIEENGVTYTASTNAHETTVHASDTNADYTVTSIEADTWVLRNPKDGTFKRVKQENMTDSNWLLEQLQSANLFIQKYNIDTKQWGDYSYVSSSLFTTEDDDSEVAKAEAEYEANMAEIQHKDKTLDLELDNIETEHTAVDQQIESVKKIVESSIDKSFKIFG